MKGGIPMGFRLRFSRDLGITRHQPCAEIIHGDSCQRSSSCIRSEAARKAGFAEFFDGFFKFMARTKLTHVRGGILPAANSTHRTSTAMKYKHYRTRIHTPLLALALASGMASAGTTETVAPAAPAGCMDWLKLSGYAAVAYTYTDNGEETFANGGSPLDAVKVGFEGTYGSFGGYVSLFYTPGVDGDDAGILDAYATYKAGDITFTGGKYLSYLGYEAFDTVNMYQLTYANGLGAIPAYHTGLKMDYSTKELSAGVSVSDSIRGGDGFWVGDEDYSNGLGYEGYVSYKGIDKLTLWAGAGFDHTDELTDWVTYDLWASYDVTSKLTLASELAYHEDGEKEGIQGLALAKYAFTEKFSTVFRFGLDDYSTDQSDTYKYTFAPTYAFCESFLIRAEVSYNQVLGDGDSVFSGIQALAKF
jgi:hypothetical protein